MLLQRALEEAYRRFARAIPAGTLIAYSVKANGNLAVLKTLATLGAGADVVSGGELKKALAAGIPASRIVFSGVGKTRDELGLGLSSGIHQFNVESEPELELLSRIAGSMGKVAAITIRVNPDIDPRTHAKISTGMAETKFGIPWRRAREAYARAASLPGMKIVGVDVHIGSQITELEPFQQAFARIAELIAILRSDGHAIARADLGGGLGVDYERKRCARSCALCRRRHSAYGRTRCFTYPGTGPADCGRVPEFWSRGCSTSRKAKASASPSSMRA